MKEDVMEMTILEEHLGRALTVRDVAEYLQVDSRTVRKYYHELGGVRFGRAYRFFERRMNNAIQAREREVAGTNQDIRDDQKKDFSNEKRGSRLGGRNKKKDAPARKARDPFDLTS